MAIYVKGVLAGAAMSVATLVLFFIATSLYAFIGMRRAVSANPADGFFHGGSFVTFSLLWPMLLAALAFVGGFYWMVRR